MALFYKKIFFLSLFIAFIAPSAAQANEDLKGLSGLRFWVDLDTSTENAGFSKEELLRIMEIKQKKMGVEFDEKIKNKPYLQFTIHSKPFNGGVVASYQLELIELSKFKRYRNRYKSLPATTWKKSGLIYSSGSGFKSKTMNILDDALFLFYTQYIEANSTPIQVDQKVRDPFSRKKI